jgi:ribonuclease J
MPDTLRIIPLGGVGEVGKNITVIEAAGEIMVVDCGWPSRSRRCWDRPRHPGRHLPARAATGSSPSLTHGHEDHTGGLPPCCWRLGARPPGRLTAAWCGQAEHGSSTSLNVVEPAVEFRVGSFAVTPFRVNHSIPDGMGFAIRTPLGTVVHTGDFKFDHTPPDGRRADLGLIAEIGNHGVEFLLSDSTRAEREGYTLSEKTVGDSLNTHVREASGRVIVATFASNISRVQQVLDAAWASGRKMVALGRSMEQNIAIALEPGYSRPREGTSDAREGLSASRRIGWS